MLLHRMLLVPLLLSFCWCSAYAQTDQQQAKGENSTQWRRAPLDVAEKSCLEGNSQACARVVILVTEENKTSSVIKSARENLSNSCDKDFYCAYYADLLRLGLGGAKDLKGSALAYKKACDSYESFHEGSVGNGDPSKKFVSNMLAALGSVDIHRESDCTKARQMSRHLPKPNVQSKKKAVATTTSQAPKPKRQAPYLWNGKGPQTKTVFSEYTLFQHPIFRAIFPKKYTLGTGGLDNIRGPGKIGQVVQQGPEMLYYYYGCKPSNVGGSITFKGQNYSYFGFHCPDGKIDTYFLPYYGGLRGSVANVFHCVETSDGTRSTLKHWKVRRKVGEDDAYSLIQKQDKKFITKQSGKAYCNATTWEESAENMMTPYLGAPERQQPAQAMDCYDQCSHRQDPTMFQYCVLQCQKK